MLLPAKTEPLCGLGHRICPSRALEGSTAALRTGEAAVRCCHRGRSGRGTDVTRGTAMPEDVTSYLLQDGFLPS